jgi:hypothetical protein
MEGNHDTLRNESSYHPPLRFEEEIISGVSVGFKHLEILVMFSNRLMKPKKQFVGNTDDGAVSGNVETTVMT